MKRTFMWGLTLVAAIGLSTACKKKDKKSGNTVAPKTAQNTPPAKTPPAAKNVTGEQLIAHTEKCWGYVDAEDADNFKTCYAADAKWQFVDSVPPMAATGPDEIAKATQPFWTAFKDLKHSLNLIVVNGNKVAVIAHASGVNDGELMGMPATNKKIGFYAAQVLDAGDDGKATRDDHYMDMGTLMAQLGAPANPMAPAVFDNEWTTPIRIVAKNDATEKANLATLKALDAAMVAKDTKTLGASYADDAEFRYLADKKVVTGRKALDASMAEWMGMNKTMKLETASMWAAGDWVVAETSVDATLAMDLPGMKGTKGKAYSQKYLEFFQLADGKIKKHWIFSNSAKFASDLGLMKNPCGAKKGG